MPTSKCVKCEAAGSYDTSHGTMDKYLVEFADGVKGEHSVKQGNKPHFTVGQEGEYECKETDFGNKIKAPYKPKSGGFTGGGGGKASGGGKKWVERDPFKEEYAKCGGFGRSYAKDVLLRLIEAGVLKTVTTGAEFLKAWNLMSDHVEAEMRSSVLVARAEWNEQVGGE